MKSKTEADPIVSSVYPDRLHYSTGELLGADDFRDEQTYHRRQLARALLHLHGSGVIAGLEATHKPVSGDEVELMVDPGLALDHAGRLIEVPRLACLRLRRWYEYIAKQTTGDGPTRSDLGAAWRSTAGPAEGVVTADVFLSFYPCDRGYTPAFASGPFDALDASQPSRVRDGYELSLVLRNETTLPHASDPWSKITGTTESARLESAKGVSLARWKDINNKDLGRPPEIPVTFKDSTAVLLARLSLPAKHGGGVPVPDWLATAWPNPRANIDNDVRHVLLPPAALIRIMAP